MTWGQPMPWFHVRILRHVNPIKKRGNSASTTIYIGTCDRPRNLSSSSGGSMLMPLAWSIVQNGACADSGPLRRRSSTYTVKNNLSFSIQYELGWLSIAIPPQPWIALCKCRSQCPPASGWPHRDLFNLQQGACIPASFHAWGHRSQGMRTYVSNREPSRACTYALMASACVVL